MTPLACEQCGYDVTSSEVREGTRFCPECGRDVRPIPPAGRFADVLWRAVRRPLACQTALLATGIMLAVAEASSALRDTQVPIAVLLAFFAMFLLAIASGLAQTIAHTTVWAKMHTKPKRKGAAVAIGSAVLAVLAVSLLGVLMVVTVIHASFVRG